MKAEEPSPKAEEPSPKAEEAPRVEQFKLDDPRGEAERLKFVAATQARLSQTPTVLVEKTA